MKSKKRKRDEEIVLTAILATGLLHFKNMLNGINSLNRNRIESPQEESQSKHAYLTDPLIRDFTNGLRHAILEWRKMFND